MRIHLLINVHREDAVEAARGVVSFLRARDCGVASDEEGARAARCEAVDLNRFAECDLIVTFGGDGTLIRAANLASERGTPILGVYYGRFGFVTQCTGEEVGACLSGFFDGRAKYEHRMMLQTDLLRGGQIVTTIHSLNEMVLQRAVTTRMLTFDVTVDGKRLTGYPADGVIVSTSTGSTGYNLSAGGPIMDPRVQAIAVTAIAPHTLSARPLILSPDSTVHIKLSTEGDAVLSGDGQTRLHLLSGDAVQVYRSTRVTNLMSLEKDDFLIKLGDRLLWSRSVFGESP